MRKVLHVGPCDSPGGMATVMRILAEHPPEGWEAELLASHAPGGLWAKWRAYRKARRELKLRCADAALRPDVVHVHTAADWSWWRKSRLIRLVRDDGVPVVVHFHSGQMDTWLAKGGEQRQRAVKSSLQDDVVRGVVLSSAWQERLAPVLGPLEVVHNPSSFDGPALKSGRDEHHLLLLGRPDPVKGHAFAVRVAQRLRDMYPNLTFTMTGQTNSPHDWINARGWVSEEEKNTLLRSTSVLLVPSAFEGQPMVVLEAISAGLPVCVSDRVIGLPDTVRTAAYNDIDAWVETISAIFADAPSHETLIASAAPYRIEDVRKRWKHIYESF